VFARHPLGTPYSVDMLVELIDAGLASPPARSLRLASEREPGPEDFDRIEGKFRIEAALNVIGLPEAMLLARE